MDREELKKVIGDAIDNTFDTMEAAHTAALSDAAAKAEALQAQLDKLLHPDPVRRMLVGASMFSNWSKDDGVVAKAGTPYDVARGFFNTTQLTGALNFMDKVAKAGATVVILSFKLTVSWSEAGKGVMDATAKKIGKALSDKAVALKIRVEVAFHHEPENDTDSSEPITVHVAKRNEWVAMTRRLSSCVRGLPNLFVGVILMGYHSYAKTGKLYPAWNLESCIPVDAVDFVYFDLYQEYGTKGHPTQFTSPEAGYITLAAFCNAKRLRHGLAEAGIMQAGFAASGKGSHFFDLDPLDSASLVGTAQLLGAAVFCYFNTQAANTINPDPTKSYYMEPGGPRENAWIHVVRNKEALVLK